MNRRLQWVQKLVDKRFRAPFEFEIEEKYPSELENLYDSFEKKLKQINADDNSVKIVKEYKEKILKIIDNYFNGKMSTSNADMLDIIGDIGKNDFAKSKLLNCEAFLGPKSMELQFFRARESKEYVNFPAKKMLHIPFDQRYKTKNQRFSIPGYPCLYVANTSYACWIELDKPSEHDFYVSPIVLDAKRIVVLNLAVSIENFTRLHDFEEDRVYTWIKLIMLMFATSFIYVGDVKNRNFKVEYVMSQLIMQSCLNLNYDGIVYNSKKICSDKMSFAAINLVLFAKQDKAMEKQNSKYAEICNRIKIDDAYNYQVFKQIKKSDDLCKYDLRVLKTGATTKVGSFDRQYDYRDTNFCDFDKFLFNTWKDKCKIPFGHIIKNLN